MIHHSTVASRIYFQQGRKKHVRSPNGKELGEKKGKGESMLNASKASIQKVPKQRKKAANS